MSIIVYAVYRKGEIVCAGTLLDCWAWLLNSYPFITSSTGSLSAVDLADEEFHISPVGDHHQIESSVSYAKNN